MTVDLAVVRATYDDRIDRARMHAAAARRSATLTRGAYDLAVGEGASPEVLDDLRLVRLRTSIDALATEHQLDMLLDEAAYETGRPR